MAYTKVLMPKGWGRLYQGPGWVYQGSQCSERPSVTYIKVVRSYVAYTMIRRPIQELGWSKVAKVMKALGGLYIGNEGPRWPTQSC